MSFKNFIKLKNEISSIRIRSLQTMDESVTYPCRCCDAQGFIVVVSKYKTHSGKELRNNSGEVISSSEIILCPNCTGTGVDLDLLQKKVREINEA
jgi:hypothetical protein